MDYNGFQKQRKSLGSYFIMAFVGAIFGSALMMLFAPTVMQPPNEVNQKLAVQGVGTQLTAPSTSTTTSTLAAISMAGSAKSPTVVGFAAGKVMPAVVGIVRPIQQKNAAGRMEARAEIGTGVIVDAGGYILTNNHVADASKDLDISLYDGRNVTGRVVWSDPILDISIVKVKQTGLPHAVLGDSKNLRIGDAAIAIGNPLGLKFQRSVTSGIVSALNRTVQMSETVFMEDLIQTDASINPGNSGGPLVNVDGEVIGINTVKVATAEGMGFAIPINMAKPVIESFKRTGDFKTPAMGIEGIDADMASYYDYKADIGVYVSKVISGSPADLAGVQPGDSIVAINGVDINTLMDLKEAIFTIGIGGEANISIITPLHSKKELRMILEQV